MKKYTITIEVEAEYIPSDVMDELVGLCAVQVEALTDGTLESTPESFKYVVTNTKWEITRDSRVGGEHE